MRKGINKTFTLRMRQNEEENQRHMKQLEFELKQKQIYFEKFNEKTKIEHETEIKIKQWKLIDQQGYQWNLKKNIYLNSLH